MSKKLLFKGGHATGMIPFEIEDFSTLYMRDARVDEKTKAYIDSVIGNSVLNLCPYRNVLVTHKYDTVEGNVITLDDCQDDEVIQLSEIQGNTMVNCCKDGSKELTLNGDIDTSGYNNVTLTEGVDGGKVDISLEGNTMVNVCDQEDPIAITKNYEVITGNHVALQGEYDGKCRPNIYGNTLVNLADSNTSKTFSSTTRTYGICKDNRIIKENTTYTCIIKIADLNLGQLSSILLQIQIEGFNSPGSGSTPYTVDKSGIHLLTFTTTTRNNSTDKTVILKGVSSQWTENSTNTMVISSVVLLEGDYTNKPIPEYFTGMKSSFEDKLIPENLYKFSSRDDFYSLNDNAVLDGEYIKMTANSKYQNAMLKPLATIKPSTTYTVVVDVVENTLNADLVVINSSPNAQLCSTQQSVSINAGKTGIFTFTVTTSNDLSNCTRVLVNYLNSVNTTGSIKYRIMVVEGDYTNYNFTDYDSSKGGKYKVDYKVTGKNKFDINNEFATTTTNGKKYITVNGNTTTFTPPSVVGIRKYFKIKVNPNTTYNINGTVSYGMVVIYKHNINTDSFTWDTSYIHTYRNYTKQENTTLALQFTTGVDEHEVYVRFSNESVSETSIFTNIQIEEGDTATTYEPYKEFIKTLYLNSPLLEGDTIEQSGNDIVHVHRYKTITFDGSDDEKWFTYKSSTDITCISIKITDKLKANATGYASVICDKLCYIEAGYLTTSLNIATYVSDKYNNNNNIYITIPNTQLNSSDKQGAIQWLQQNPVTVVYELATPTREIISTNDNLLLDSYINGHLDVDSIVPIDKVVFQQTFIEGLKYLYPNTEYTIQFESDNIGKLHYYMGGVYDDIDVVKGINKFNLTTKDKINWLSLDLSGIGFNASKVVVTPKVDGDFGYFKGMKSVGQDDTDGHKIEILSHNGNLYKRLENSHYKVYGSTVTIIEENENGFIYKAEGWDMGLSYLISTEGLFKNKKYRLSWEKNDTTKTAPILHTDGIKLLNSNKLNKEIIPYTRNGLGYDFELPNSFEHGDILEIRFKNSVLSVENGACNICINEIGVAKNTAISKLNKKEILMNEPLRGLPNGVKDKYVIIDGKWYIERNTIQLIMDSTFIQDKTLHHYVSTDYGDVIGFSTPNNWFKWSSSLICNNLVYDGHRNISAGSLISNQEKIFVYDYIFITLNKNKVSTLNEAGFREYLKNNPITLVGQNTTPTYEPIDYNPFEVYTDITHISNNSIIPCNMVIKNSGYNCILKPSTLYTVALDTNKSGTIGMNLGGAKGTTSNNITTITTPATLVDNTLRLYGKGIKASGVRLLEGDKTNWIPSHFEGMKSCFEDRLQDDGKYKMEILMNNENLLDIKNISYKNTTDYKLENNKIIINTSKKYQGLYYYIPVKRGSRYTICCKNITGGGILLYNGKTTGHMVKKFLGGIDNNANPKKISVVANEDYITIRVSSEVSVDMDCIFEDTLFYKGMEKVDYVPHKQNKIQFLLNEPLRGVGNVKDKVYVKEDKVVVERNCGNIILDGSDDEGLLIVDKPDTGYGYYRTRITLGKLGLPNGNYLKIKMNNLTVSEGVGNYYGYICTFDYGSFLFVYHKFNNLQQYLQANPTTVVYQLATPVYEEVEFSNNRLTLDSYDNSTLFYDTNIPVTTQFYEFNVNIKDMLIPNETYYVTFNADRVKDITINLSGVQVNYKTSMGYNKVPIQLGDVVNTNFSMDSRGVELSDLMISTSTSLIYVKDMNDVCVYDEATNKYSITITSTNGKESDKRVILLDYPLLKLNKDIYDRLYYSNKDSRYRIEKKVFKHKFTNDHEYSKYAAETNDTYYSSFISLNEAIKDYVVITNEKVKTVKVEDDKYYFKIKWSDLGVSDKTEANGNQGVKDFFNNNEVYLYYATDGFVEIVDGLTKQTLKVYQPETTMKFLGNTTTTVTILIPMKNV